MAAALVERRVRGIRALPSWAIRTARRLRLAGPAFPGFSVFHWINPALATTMTFPVLRRHGLAFARRYWQRRVCFGDPSAFSPPMAVDVRLLPAVLSTQPTTAIIFGYASTPRSPSSRF